MTRIIVFTLSLVLSVGTPAAVIAAGPDHIRLYTVKRDFETVKEDLGIAITNHGLVIDHTSNISAMLERTGKDIGATKQVYGNAGSMQFCTAGVSRRTMEADPSNIAFCPYIIFYYTLPQDPKTVYVGYRRPLSSGPKASRAALREIETLLDAIVKEGLNIK
jgi:hypothetical protein